MSAEQFRIFFFGKKIHRLFDRQWIRGGWEARRSSMTRRWRQRKEMECSGRGDDRGITHQPYANDVTMFWGNYLSDFSMQWMIGVLPTNLLRNYANKVLGKLFVRFLKAMHNVTHQPVTIQINIMQTKCLRKYFFSDTSGENTTNQNKWPNIPSIEVPTTLSMYLLIICWVDPKQFYICWYTMCIKNIITHLLIHSVY